MTLNKAIGVLLLLGLFLTSCKKQKEDVIPSNDNECFFSTTLDSTRIYNKLVGKWKWQYSFAGWTSQYSDEEYKGLVLEFKTGGELVVRRSGAAPQTVRWSLAPGWQLVTDPFLVETIGPIHFCEDQLLFQGGAYDGTSNYYGRE